MPESEDLSTKTEGGNGASGESTNQNQEVLKTDTDSTDAATQSGEATTKTVEQEAKLDLSKVSADELVSLLTRDDVKEKFLESDAAKRLIQSEKDKELLREKRRLATEARQREEEEQAKLRAEEKRKLIQEKNADALLELEAQEIEDADALSKSAAKVARTIEKVARQHPEFTVLGDEKIEDIYAKVSDDGGNAVDLIIELAKARREMEVASAKAETAKTIDEKIKEEVEARLAAMNLGTRSAETDGVSQSITVDSTNRANVKPTTYEEASLAYGDGRLSTEEFKPWIEKHEKERQY